MQSFCGSIRLVRRHNINSSKIVGFISDRKFPVSSGSDLGTLISNHSVSNGGGAFNFVGTSTDYSKDWLFQSQPKFTSRSLLELGIIQRESFAIYLCFDCLTCVEECLEVLLSDMCPRRAQLLLRNTKSGIQTDLLISSNNGGVPWVAPIRRGARTSFFHPSAALPTLPSRCITTMHDSVKSSAEDTSAPVSNVSPRIKFKRPDKTAGHIMQILDKEAVEEVRKQREIPDIKPGYIIQLKVEAPQNKRRVSILKGIVIARRNAGLNTTFRLRRLVAGVGVESLFPLYSPNIKEIKVLDKNNVRRAKLYYLRDKMNPLRKQ